MTSSQSWAVSLAKKATRDLDELPVAEWPRVRRATDELADDPFRGDVQPLHGKEWKGYFRKRAGNYRVIFTIDHDAHVVTIHSVLRRSEKTYR